MILETSNNNHLKDHHEVSFINEIESIRSVLKMYSRHHLSGLLLSPDAALYSKKDVGYVGYSIRKNVLIVIGGFMCDPDKKKFLASEFLKWCKQFDYKVFFVHMPKNDIAIINEFGFKTNQIGATYSLELDKFSFKGRKFSQLRNKLNRIKKQGVVVKRIRTQHEFAAIRNDLDKINQEWLADKKAKPLRILVTDFDRISVLDGDVAFYAAFHESRLVSYVIYTKTYGEHAGWFHNLSRRSVSCIDGTMQLINEKFIEDHVSDTNFLHFGFTPLVEVGNEAGNYSKIVSTIVKFLSDKGGIVYPARAQRQYKMSWRPTVIDAEYVGFKGNTLISFLYFLRAINSI